jgi:hypothetical protein
MALSFTISDLDTLANLAQAHPTPVTFWTWVKNNTSNLELTDVANKMIFDWNAAGTTPLAEARRTADAIQELQAIEQTIDVVRQEDQGQGVNVTTQVRCSVVKV